MKSDTSVRRTRPPRPFTKKRSENLPTLPTVSLSIGDRERVRARLEESIATAADAWISGGDEEGEARDRRQSTRAEQARFVGTYDRKLRRWLRGPALPNDVAELYAIALRTGDSWDWILGLPSAPRRRGDNQHLAHEGDLVRQHIETIGNRYRRHPIAQALQRRDGAPLPDPGAAGPRLAAPWEHRVDPLPESPTDLIAEVVRAWWETRVAMAATKWRDALRHLQSRMDIESVKVHEENERRGLMEKVELIGRTLAQLESPSGKLSLLFQLETRGALQAANNPVVLSGPETVYKLKEPVLAAQEAFAWRGTKHDHAWYLDDGLEVTARKRGRFLEAREELGPLAYRPSLASLLAGSLGTGGEHSTLAEVAPASESAKRPVRRYKVKLREKRT